MWVTAAESSPDISFYMVCFILVNSGVAFAGGNPAGIVVSLCAIAAWCFSPKEVRGLRHRDVLQSASPIKPHDSGLVWLYFLLFGRGASKARAFRRFSSWPLWPVPAFLWVTHVAPPTGSMSCKRTCQSPQRTAAMATRGRLAGLGVSPGMIIDLQTIFSVLRDDPHFYNPITYLICGPMLVAWVIVTDSVAVFANKCVAGVGFYCRPFNVATLPPAT